MLAEDQLDAEQTTICLACALMFLHTLQQSKITAAVSDAVRATVHAGPWTELD